LTIVLHLFAGDGSETHLSAREGWRHPFTYQTFSYIVGFAVVFRNGSAYQRFNQARNDLQALSGKLVEATVQICTYDLVTKEGPAQESGKEFRRSYIHLVSLLHALCFQYLRSDWCLDNLCPHVPGAHPVQDSGKLPMVNSIPVLFSWSYWSTILCLQTSQHAQELYNSLMPLLVVGGIDEEEKKTLFPSMDGGDLYLGHLAPTAVRIETVYSWLHRLILARSHSGGLQVPSPVLSRSYQVLNDAMNSFHLLQGVSDIPFPFPYSNAIVLILCIYTLTVPMLMWIWIQSSWFGALLAFIATFTYWTLNEIARDLEDPFLYEPNDLPLPRIQFLFNERILAIERETGSMERPPNMAKQCNSWLGQNSPLSYQSVESHGLYEKIDWSNVPEDNTYFNCIVNPKKVVERRVSNRKRGSGVFGQSMFQNIQRSIQRANAV
jgi:predicted membrane chloride channel (bestrophin family)